MQVDDAGLHLGGSVTLTRVMETCKKLIASLPAHQVSASRHAACFARAAPELRLGKCGTLGAVLPAAMAFTHCRCWLPPSFPL